jgi:hypothetical protein
MSNPEIFQQAKIRCPFLIFFEERKSLPQSLPQKTKPATSAGFRGILAVRGETEPYTF